MSVIFLWGRHTSLDFMRCPSFWIHPYVVTQHTLTGCSQPVLHQMLVGERGSAFSLQNRWDRDLKCPDLRYGAFTESFSLFSSPSFFLKVEIDIICQHSTYPTPFGVFCAASWWCSLEQSFYHPFQVWLLCLCLDYSHGFGNFHGSCHQTAGLSRKLLEYVPPSCSLVYGKGPHAPSEL